MLYLVAAHSISDCSAWRGNVVPESASDGGWGGERGEPVLASARRGRLNNDPAVGELTLPKTPNFELVPESLISTCSYAPFVIRSCQKSFLSTIKDGRGGECGLHGIWLQCNQKCAVVFIHNRAHTKVRASE